MQLATYRFKCPMGQDTSSQYCSSLGKARVLIERNRLSYAAIIAPVERNEVGASG
jgi:hypothetical protein